MSDATDELLQVNVEDGFVLVSGRGIALSLSPSVAADAAHRLEAAAAEAARQHPKPDDEMT